MAAVATILAALSPMYGALVITPTFTANFNTHFGANAAAAIWCRTAHPPSLCSAWRSAEWLCCAGRSADKAKYPVPSVS